MLNACPERLGSRLFGGETRSKALGSRGSGAAIGDFVLGKNATQEAFAKSLDGVDDAGNFYEIDAGTHEHVATVAQQNIFRQAPRRGDVIVQDGLSDGRGVRENNQQPAASQGWDLNLVAQCSEDAARTVRFLTGAVMACGGCVLSRRFDGAETAAIEFEFARAACVEMYSVLIATGLELSAQSHLTMAALCQCTRETIEATGGDPVRVDLTIRRPETAVLSGAGGTRGSGAID